MTLGDLHTHSAIASLFKWDFRTVVLLMTISTVTPTVRRAVPPQQLSFLSFAF